MALTELHQAGSGLPSHFWGLFSEWPRAATTLLRRGLAARLHW